MISPAVGEAYGRAGELAERHGDERRLFQALYGVYQHNVGSGRIFAALPLAERLLSVTAHEDTDPGLRLQAHHALWTALLIGGEPARCLEHCEIGRRRYDPERYQSHRDLYGGHDAGACAWMMGSQAEWLLGRPGTALTSSTTGVTLAERISHTPSLIFALSYAASLHVYRREPELILARLTAAEAVAAEQRLSVFISPQLLRGMALFLRGQLRDAIVYLREGLPPGRTGGVRSLGFSILAVALAQQGDHAEGLAGLSEALQSVKATGEGFWNVELHRSRGLVLQSQNKLPESEVAFRQALQLARQQQAKSWELRVATSLAGLGRAGPARRSPGASGARLWLVHRGFRHTRSEGGEGTARQLGLNFLSLKAASRWPIPLANTPRARCEESAAQPDASRVAASDAERPAYRRSAARQAPRC
jgi:predicted ATPase